MFQNPTGKSLHVEHISIVNDLTLAGSNRIYWPYIPVIESGFIVGIFTTRANRNISIITTLPVPGENVGLTIAPQFNFITVTLVNKKGETILSEYPYALLFPENGNITPIHATNLDSRKCFYQFVPGFVAPTIPLSAPIAFYLRHNK